MDSALAGSDQRGSRIGAALTTILRWLLVVSAAFVPLVFDPWRPAASLLTAKLNAVWAIGALAFVLWVIRRVLARETSPRLRGRLAWPVSSLAAALTVATWLAPNRAVSLWGSWLRGEGLLTMMSYLVVALVTAHELQDTPAFQRRWIIALVAGAAGNALYALVQFAGLDPVWDYQSFLRPFAMQGHASMLGGYLAMMGAVVALTSATVRRTGAQIAFLVLAAVLYLGLLTTGTRSGWAAIWVATGVVWLLVFWRADRAARVRAATTVAVLIAMTVLFLLPNGPFARTIDEGVLARVTAAGGVLAWTPGQTHPDARPPLQRLAMTAEHEGGVPVRLMVWRAATRSWMRRPLFGQGIDSFRYWPDGQAPPTARPSPGVLILPLFHYDRVHNEFLEMAVAAGIFGLTAFLWVLAAFLFPALRSAIASGDAATAGAVAGALAYLLVVQVQPSYLGSSFVFWSLLGYGAARARWVRATGPGPSMRRA